MAVRASVAFATPGGVLRQDLLAGERRIASSSPGGVAAHVAIRVPDIVAVFLVESVIGDELESLPPEDEAVLQGQTYPFEEKRVL